MFTSTKTITPDSLISLISEEYEHQKTQKSHRSGKTKEDDKDEALAVGSSMKGKGRKFPHGVCWNCGKKGHYKDKCPKPAKVTKNLKKESELKKSDSMNAVGLDSKSEAAFLMSYDSDSVELDVEKLDFERDWFSEVEEDEWESIDSESDSLEIHFLQIYQMILHSSGIV